MNTLKTVSVKGPCYLQPAEYLRQLGERVFLVHELLPVQVSEAGSVERHSEVSPEHALPVQLIDAGEGFV